MTFTHEDRHKYILKIILAMVIVIISNSPTFSIDVKTQIDKALNTADKLNLVVEIIYNKNYEQIRYSESDIKIDSPIEIEHFIVSFDELDKTPDEISKDYNISTDKEVQIQEYHNDEVITKRITYTFQVFETKDLYIKPLRISYQFKNEPKTIYTVPIPILSRDIDIIKNKEGKVALIGLKGPFEDKKRPWLYIIIAIGIVLIILIIMIIVVIKKRKAKATLDNTLSPMEKALSDIETIKESLAKKEIQIKEFYLKLSDIVREFTGNIIGISIMESSTNKVKSTLESAIFDPDKAEKLITLLNNTDRVKFAKYNPTQNEIKKDIDDATKLIKDFEEQRLKEKEMAELYN